jgi:hypothetical protein
MKSWPLILLTLTAFLLVSSESQATPLFPGGNVSVTTETALPAGSFFFGPETLAITGVNALGQTRFTGNLTFAVYRESATGFLDFLYQYQNNASSRDAVQHVSTTDFSLPFTTDVRTITATAPTGFTLGTTVAADATRSTGTGGVVSFDFPTPNSVAPGTTSEILVIDTNATNIVPGTTNIINGAIATVITQAPRNSPEPATLTLFGGGLLGLAGLFGRRWWKGSQLSD